MARLTEISPNPEYIIILYYKYVSIEKPQKLVDAQRDLCEKLNLKGRIIISAEGINGTLEGKKAEIERYCADLVSDARFADIHFKKSVGIGNAFPKLKVKLRKEIVTGHLDAEDVNPAKLTGKRLAPDQLREWFEQGKDFTIVDMRNDYEQKVGQFRGSVMSGMQNFRDLPKTADLLEPVKEKAVLTVCTGGVRCEKASGYLVKKGFKDVYQLDGGIVSYMEKYPGKDFLGSLYVFDGRVTMTFDKPEDHIVIGKCAFCNQPSEKYVDCKDDICHRHFICCDNCFIEKEGVLCLSH